MIGQRQVCEKLFRKPAVLYIRKAVEKKHFVTYNIISS